MKDLAVGVPVFGTHVRIVRSRGPKTESLVVLLVARVLRRVGVARVVRILRGYEAVTMRSCQ